MSTDAAYNAPSRIIDVKIELYIRSAAAAPLEITRENYLIDVDILDEASSDSESPFGVVTANEVSFTLFNDNGIFSPTNASSPYYGLMRKGIKCNVLMRANEQSWDSVGTFYVTDWQATVTGTTASVYAHDKLYGVFNQPDIDLPVLMDITYADYFASIFQALQVSAVIDDTLTEKLTMAYSVVNNKNLLNYLATGALALCFCDHSGNIKVDALLAQRDIRATITDADQILKAEASFGLNTGYSGARLTYYTPQESAAYEVIRVDNLDVPVGLSSTGILSITDKALIRLLYASLIGYNDAYVERTVASSRHASVNTRNMEEMPVQLPLSIYGTCVDNLSTTIGSETGNDLAIDNVYIQTKSYANSYLRVLENYASNTMPRVTIEARGNPLLNIGDKIHVQSTKYNIDFTGILLKQHFSYNGALTSTMELLDAAVLEVT